MTPTHATILRRASIVALLIMGAALGAGQKAKEDEGFVFLQDGVEGLADSQLERREQACRSQDGLGGEGRGSPGRRAAGAGC
jgi:hypothetical protein